jgi:hypothetical protein
VTEKIQAQQGTHELRTGGQGRAIANQNGGTPTEGNQVHRLKVTRTTTESENGDRKIIVRTTEVDRQQQKRKIKLDPN